MTTDRQAALAAAAEIMAGWVTAPTAETLNQVERHTLTMATSFLRWLEGRRPLPGERTPADADERLKPNVDFNAPTQATTHSLDPEALKRLAAERLRLAKGEHFLSTVLTTPSGKYACICGQSWPCSERRADDFHAETQAVRVRP